MGCSRVTVKKERARLIRCVQLQEVREGITYRRWGGLDSALEQVQGLTGVPSLLTHTKFPARRQTSQMHLLLWGKELSSNTITNTFIASALPIEFSSIYCCAIISIEEGSETFDIQVYRMALPSDSFHTV